MALICGDPKGYNFSYREIWHTERDLYNKSIPEYQEQTATATAVLVYGLAKLDHKLSREGYYVERQKSPLKPEKGQEETRLMGPLISLNGFHGEITHYVCNLGWDGAFPFFDFLLHGTGGNGLPNLIPAFPVVAIHNQGAKLLTGCCIRVVHIAGAIAKAIVVVNPAPAT